MYYEKIPINAGLILIPYFPRHPRRRQQHSHTPPTRARRLVRPTPLCLSSTCFHPPLGHTFACRKIVMRHFPWLHHMIPAGYGDIAGGRRNWHLRVQAPGARPLSVTGRLLAFQLAHHGGGGRVRWGGGYSLIFLTATNCKILLGKYVSPA